MRRRYSNIIKVILVGQPNVGKSSLFNILSGKSVRVSNWAGTTVEIKSGKIVKDGLVIEIVDIPGTYSLTPTTLEERVAREYILKESADIYVVLVDVLTIERSLMLAIELLELKPNVIIALTKCDIAHKYGIHVNYEGLSKKLGVPVIPISAYTGEGIEELLRTITRYTYSRGQVLKINYEELEKYFKILDRCGEHILKILNIDVDKRWIILKLLEGDDELLRILEESDLECFKDVKNVREEFYKMFGKYPEDYIYEIRSRYLRNVLEGNIVRTRVEIGKLSKIDRLFTHSILGPIISLLILTSSIFTALIINMGFPLNILFYALGFSNIANIVENYSISGILDRAFDLLGSYLSSLTSNVVLSRAIYGIVSSVGAVLSLAPLVFIMSAVLAILEDSGIGARMAISMHSLLSRFGLSGRSIYPILVGFGCNVPAVLSSRTAIDHFERVQIAMTVPFIPCQARMIILLYMATMFIMFKPVELFSFILLTICIGVLLTLISSLMFRRVLYRLRTGPELLLEIPPLHRPKLRVVWWISWSTTKHFLEKAGTVIFISCLIIWTMLHYGPTGFTMNISQSYAAIFGKYLGYIFEKILNISQTCAWKLGLATIAGIVAKENIIAILSILGNLKLSKIQMIAFTIFTMLYMPCIPTIIAIAKEVGIRKAIITTIYMFTIAILISYLTYTTLKGAVV